MRATKKPLDLDRCFWAETLPLPCHATNPTILLLDAADARLTRKSLGGCWVLPGTPIIACLDKPPAKLRRPKVKLVKASQPKSPRFNSTIAHLAWSIWGFAHGLSACASSSPLIFTTTFFDISSGVRFYPIYAPFYAFAASFRVTVHRATHLCLSWSSPILHLSDCPCLPHRTAIHLIPPDLRLALHKTGDAAFHGFQTSIPFLSLAPCAIRGRGSCLLADAPLFLPLSLSARCDYRLGPCFSFALRLPAENCTIHRLCWRTKGYMTLPNLASHPALLRLL
jgi:hypothetical protein